MDGIIVIYKEKGFTSHDVVAKLRGMLHQKRIGHTGTLDPEAVGVLPVCLGKATKLCDRITDRTKEYEAVLRLGVETDTEDMTGTVTARCPVTCSDAEIEAALRSFVGPYQQIPPMYSAIKVDGKKLYQLARAGQEIRREPRSVEIFSAELLEILRQQEEVRVRFAVSCSKGTYIRSLCRDIGKQLGCGGAMESLVRRRVGPYTLSDAVPLDRLQTLAAEGRAEEVLIPIRRLLEGHPVFICDAAHDKALKNGNALLLSWGTGEAGPETLVLDHTGGIVGIYERRGDRLKVTTML